MRIVGAATRAGVRNVELRKGLPRRKSKKPSAARHDPVEEVPARIRVPVEDASALASAISQLLGMSAEEHHQMAETELSTLDVYHDITMLANLLER